MPFSIIAKIVAPVAVAGIVGGVGYVVSLSSDVSAIKATHAAEQPAISQRFDRVERTQEQIQADIKEMRGDVKEILRFERKR